MTKLFQAAVWTCALGAAAAAAGPPPAEAPQAQPLVELTHYRSGISLIVEGRNGVDYAFERFYCDPLVDDHGVIYLRSATPLGLEHNETNGLSTNHRLEAKNIGVNGRDGRPASGDEGLIRYKVDLDWNWRYAWAAGEAKKAQVQLPLCPQYEGPLTFDDLKYFDGVKVLGSTGPSRALQPYPQRGDAEFYFRGLRDECGEEWHTLTVGDDDSAVPGQTWYEEWNSDGKIFYFVVNPRTPAIGFLPTGPQAQYYTTPAKAYFVPRIHAQTTYATAGLALVFSNLTDATQPVQYKLDEVHGESWQVYSGAVALDGLGLKADTVYTLRCRIGAEGPQRVRKVHYEPSFPSDREPHPSPVLFKNRGVEERLRKLMAGDKTYRGTFEELRSPFCGGLGTYLPPLRQGARHIGGSGCEANAFVAYIGGLDKESALAKVARQKMLDCTLNLDPIGFERSHNTSGPCRELVHHGYYAAATPLAVAVAYDLLIKDFRRPRYADGFTAIEDYKIRDLLGSYALTTLQMKGFPNRVVIEDPSAVKEGGMWDTAREMALNVISMMIPEYDTPYFGTSGARGRKATHPLTPYADQPMSWFECCNSKRHGAGFYYLLRDADNVVWTDRAGYFGGRMMGWLFLVQSNARANFDGLHYPHVERGLRLAMEGKLPALKFYEQDERTVNHRSCLVINEEFPELAKLAYAQLTANGGQGLSDPGLGEKSLGYSMWYNGVFGLLYCRLDWPEHVAQPARP